MTVWLTLVIILVSALFGCTPASAQPLPKASPASTLASKSASQAPSLTLADFIRIYLDSSSDYQSAALQVQETEAEAQIAGDLFQSTLEVTPNWVSKEQRFQTPGLTIADEGADINATLNQQLPTGTALSLNIFRTVTERDAGIAGLTDAKYSIGVTQSLYRNSFGRLFRLRKEAATTAVDRDKKKLSAQALRSCSESSELFSAAWLASERLSLFQQIEASAKEALNNAESASRARLIRRLDLLSARADHLRVQSLVAEANNVREKAFESLNGRLRQTGRAAVAAVSSPQDWFNRPFNEKSGAHLSKNVSLEALKLQVDALDRAAAAAREAAKSQVNLVLEGGRAEGRAPVGGDVSRFNEDYVKVGLSLELPLHNQTLKSEAALQELRKQRAEWAYREAQREAETGFAQRLSDLETIKGQLESTEKRADIYQEQTREAFNLIRSGRIEFEDYLRFRDSYLNERLRVYELRHELWSRRSQLAVLLNDFEFVCGGQP